MDPFGRHPAEIAIGLTQDGGALLPGEVGKGEFEITARNRAIVQVESKRNRTYRGARANGAFEWQAA